MTESRTKSSSRYIAVVCPMRSREAVTPYSMVTHSFESFALNRIASLPHNTAPSPCRYLFLKHVHLISFPVSIWIYPFFWHLATSQLVTSQEPQTNELLQRKVTQTKKGNTKHNQTTTILFFTLLLTYGFLETIQIQTQEENIG